MWAGSNRRARWRLYSTACSATLSGSSLWTRGRRRQPGGCSRSFLTGLKWLSVLAVILLAANGCARSAVGLSEFCLLYEPMPEVFQVRPEAALAPIISNEIAYEELCD